MIGRWSRRRAIRREARRPTLARLWRVYNPMDCEVVVFLPGGETFAIPPHEYGDAGGAVVPIGKHRGENDAYYVLKAFGNGHAYELMCFNLCETEQEDVEVPASWGSL